MSQTYHGTKRSKNISLVGTLGLFVFSLWILEMFSTASTLSVFEKDFLRIFQCHSYVLHFCLCFEKYLDFLQCLVFMLLFGRNILMSCIYAFLLASSKFNLRKCGLSRGEQPYNFSKKPFNLVSTFNLNFNQSTNINNPILGKLTHWQEEVFLVF